MRKMRVAAPVVLLGLAMVMGCAKPPQEAIDSAKQALENARTAGAADYAATSLTDAESAMQQLETELAAQEKKFALLRSYKNATTMAATAAQSAEKAVTDAQAGKERTRGEAEGLIAQARTAMEEANTMLATAPAGKGSQMDIEMMKADLAGVATTLAEAEAAFQQEGYLQAKAKAEAAVSAAGSVKAAVEQAAAMRAGAKGKM